MVSVLIFVVYALFFEYKFVSLFIPNGVQYCLFHLHHMWCLYHTVCCVITLSSLENSDFEFSKLLRHLLRLVLKQQI